MKTISFFTLWLLGSSLLFTGVVGAQNQLTAKEIISRADKKMQGESSIGTMSMTIIRKTWQRTLVFKNWIKSPDYALTLVTAPAKEKGQTFLKRGNDMWNYLPKISRMIKLPPSMMAQGWMGSDYTNDDIMNETSMVDDFNHRILGSEELQGRSCYKIEMLPHEESTIVWGKVIAWISKDDFLFIKYEYYDEDNFLVRTEIASDIKKMDDRIIPTQFEIIPADEPGQKTIIKILSMDFDVPIKDSFFSQQNMKRVR